MAFHAHKWILFAIFLLSISWKAADGDSTAGEVHTIKIVKEFPHDPEAFTQGLLYAGNGTLYESTGLFGKSSVRRVNLQTGKVELITKMDASIFGEGLTLLDRRLFQVTWRTNKGFGYNRRNLKQIGTFTHEMKDGWGLATDGNVVFGSDGSSILYHLHRDTFRAIRKLNVTYNGRPVKYLNELEYINGEVWANVWQTDCIARISPEGRLIGWILLPTLREGLIASGNKGIDVLNGIAWDFRTNRVFVTGKLWPKLFQIVLVPIMGNLSAETIAAGCIIP